MFKNGKVAGADGVTREMLFMYLFDQFISHFRCQNSCRLNKLNGLNAVCLWDGWWAGEVLGT